MSDPKTLDLVAFRKRYDFGDCTTDCQETVKMRSGDVVSLLDQIDEWEATDKANADERKQLLDRIEELEHTVVRLNDIIGEGPS